MPDGQRRRSELQMSQQATAGGGMLWSLGQPVTTRDVSLWLT
ncbi:hypothetical protein BH20ACT4_BH20ACT4_13850 [soil metagenome]